MGPVELVVDEVLTMKPIESHREGHELGTGHGDNVLRVGDLDKDPPPSRPSPETGPAVGRSAEAPDASEVAGRAFTGSLTTIYDLPQGQLGAIRPGPTDTKERRVRILLVTAGTRGDVEPFAVLARRAVEAGHAVRVGVPDNSGVDLVGLDTASLGVDFRPLIEAQGISALLAVRAFRTHIRPAMARLLQRALELIVDWDPDVVLAHPKVLTAPLGAAHLGVPCYWVETVPSWTPTTAFAAPGIPLSGPGPVNRLTYRLVQAAGSVFRAEVKFATRVVGLDPDLAPATTGSFVPASPQILARPPDWPASTHLTGTWTRRETGGLPPEVRAFAEAGPFLYAGFGSMAAGDPQARARAVADAARATGLRTLLASGWGGLSVPPDRSGPDVLQVPAVDHGAVLPLACVAVHHGGAGTVHAVTAAGIPSVVVPFVADQPFWAHQLASRGLAPAPIPQRRLTTNRLTRALSEALEMRDHTAQVGALVRAEDGPATTLRILENNLRAPGTHP